MVVSNPTYITNSEKKLISNNVKSFEPHSALFVEDNDPLYFYQNILEFSIFNLT
jgi:release factor glutamine methyltransferase